ncbi:MAG: endonuclease/exonuclease/phosphatase family protein [Clostridia bacterium]|nr:endonuclease/exonuclease/phosphatase family protein [Clostridia bacterium]
MKIMTFNIQHAKNFLTQEIDIPLFIDAIKKQNADICGLNEVYNEGPRECNTDQAGAIGKGLGFYDFFGEAIKTGGENPYGNAMVSRYPFKSVEKVDIPDIEDKSTPRFEHRCAVKAVFEIDGKDITVITSHFGLSDGEKQNAVKKICELVDECDMPVVIMGDFNMRPDDEKLKPLFERLNDTTVMDKGQTNTFRSDEPYCKIDYILYKGLKCVSCVTVNEIYSDHLPIVTEFEL